MASFVVFAGNYSGGDWKSPCLGLRPTVGLRRPPTAGSMRGVGAGASHRLAPTGEAPRGGDFNRLNSYKTDYIYTLPQLPCFCKHGGACKAGPRRLTTGDPPATPARDPLPLPGRPRRDIPLWSAASYVPSGGEEYGFSPVVQVGHRKSVTKCVRIDRPPFQAPAFDRGIRPNWMARRSDVGEAKQNASQQSPKRRPGQDALVGRV